MNYIIVEDEFLVRSSLQILMTKYFPQIQFQGEFSNLQELDEWIKFHTVDLILMDINLPDGSGMEYLRSHDTLDSYVVFITAYPNFAVEAFRISALDYLLKPVSQDQFIAAIHKFTEQYSIESRVLNGSETVEDSRPCILPGTKRMIVPSQSGYLIFSLGSVIRLSGEGNYTRIITEDQGSVIVSITLKIFEIPLAHLGFFRVHKSHIVNLDYIKTYRKISEGGTLILFNNDEIPVSKKTKSDFGRMLGYNSVCIGIQDLS